MSLFEVVKKEFLLAYSNQYDSRLTVLGTRATKYIYTMRSLEFYI